jgi:hypothetical protein
LKIIAAAEDPTVIGKRLAHPGLPIRAPPRAEVGHTRVHTVERGCASESAAPAIRRSYRNLARPLLSL